MILTEKSIYCIILEIEGYLQGRKVNFKVKMEKNINLGDTNKKKCNKCFQVILTSFSCHFD